MSSKSKKYHNIHKKSSLLTRIPLCWDYESIRKKFAPITEEEKLAVQEVFNKYLTRYLRLKEEHFEAWLNQEKFTRLDNDEVSLYDPESAWMNLCGREYIINVKTKTVRIGDMN